MNKIHQLLQNIKALFLLCLGVLAGHFSFAQAVIPQLTGKVSDSEDRPVPGVVITVKGLATVTNR